MKMRVVFIVRSTFDSVRGGDTLQALSTARELSKLGVEVDIKKASERIDYQRYDLMHLFNLIRPSDHLVHIEKAGLPYVLSTIYLDYSMFDLKGRGGAAGILFRLTGKHHAEYLKNCYRVLKKQDKLVSPSYLLGHRRSAIKVLEHAGMLLPNSVSENNRLIADFGLRKDFIIIPNGIDTKIFQTVPDVERRSDQVLCVGQIYGLKNQHSLIEATRNMNIKLVIIGKPPPNHRSYYDFCRKTAHKDVHFHDFMTQEKLVGYYAGSKVHALPSWFETTGLSSLEAGAMGCNLVVGIGGDTREYFQDHASFCDAANLENIRKALETELQKPSDFGFREYVLTHYTWERAAFETRRAYMKVLGNE